MTRLKMRWSRLVSVLGVTFVLVVGAGPLSEVAGINKPKVESKTLLGSYLAGRFARSQHDNSKAAEFYARALAKDPDNDLILERTFLLETISGDWDRAIPLAEKVVDNEKSHQIARFVLGVVAAKEGRNGEARDHFVKARKGTLADLTAKLARAWILLADGKGDRALTELAEMKKAEWSQFYQQYHRGLIAELAGRKKIADEALAEAFESRPRTLRIAEAYARHASNAGDAKLAAKILREHLAKAAEHPVSQAMLADVESGKALPLAVSSAQEGLAEVFYGIGDALTGEDSMEMGLVYLQLSLYLREDFPLANLAIGEVYDQMKKYERSIQAYDRIPEASPLWMSVQIRKAYALNSLERTDEAKELLERIAGVFPDTPRPLDALGSILRSKERYAEAEKFYSKAIALVDEPQKQHWSLYYARGVCYERIKQWPKAEADLKMALKLNPEQPLVLNYLGYSWVDQGINLKEAMAHIRKAVKLKPDDGYFVDSLGWAHFRLGDYQEAVKQLERAVELRPDDPVINDHLGDAYWQVGRKLEAKYQWSHALTLDPEPEDEKEIRKKLESGLAEPVNVVVASSDAKQATDAAKTAANKANGPGNTPEKKTGKELGTPVEEKKNNTGKADKQDNTAAMGAKPSKLKKTPNARERRTHVVTEGETLWDIAEEYFGEGRLFKLIYNANKTVIKNPNLIYRGQKLEVPQKP